MKFQLPLILPLSALAVGLLLIAALAPQRPAGSFAVVTFTPEGGGAPWIDSGWIVADHEYRDPNNIGGKEYTYRFLEFADHVNEYHLDEGRVDVVYPQAGQ